MEMCNQMNISELNDLDEDTRVEIEGFRTGTYVRLEVNSVPFELVEHFDPCHPILVGGIGLGEENTGYMQASLKRHRWHRKVLKTKDPIIVSIGWRRFQTTPVYAIEDRNGRHRMLKYTPEHMHCFAMFWGPLAPPKSGVLAVQNLSNNQVMSDAVDEQGSSVVKKDRRGHLVQAIVEIKGMSLDTVLKLMDDVKPADDSVLDIKAFTSHLYTLTVHSGTKKEGISDLTMLIKACEEQLANNDGNLEVKVPPKVDVPEDVEDSTAY